MMAVELARTPRERPRDVSVMRLDNAGKEVRPADLVRSGAFVFCIIPYQRKRNPHAHRASRNHAHVQATRIHID